uniref:CCHC-type domain-containing protein n=1 Tax=Chenopodium quinoa TaxID=63459 RepID=A0A803MF12_CHEQI
MKEEEWKILDRQALGVVRLTLAKSVAYNVKDVTTTVGVIKALTNMYEKPSAMNKVFLMRRLFEIEMNDGGSAPEHINEFNSIISQLASLKCDGVRDLILSESLKRKNSGESSSGAYSSEGRGRGRQQRGAQKGRSKSRGRSKSKGKVNIVCWGCGVKGHTKRDCPNPKKKGGSNHKNHDDASSSVSLASSDELGDALILSVDSPIESWILDSGASFHSSPCKEIFQNFKSGKFGKVYLADDEPLDIVGKGDVMIKTSSGSSWKLEDVRYLEGVKGSYGGGSGHEDRHIDNFGGKSVERESIGDEWKYVELDGEVKSGKEVEQVEVEVPIQQASPQHGAHVPVDSDSSDSDDDDHFETDERVVMGEPVVVQGEISTPPTWLLRYLLGTSSMALCFGRNEVVLEGFVDADFGGCYDSSKSTSGYVYTIGGTAISWMSKLQKCVSMSTTEAEYVAMSEAGKEMEWLKGFLEEMGMKQDVCALYSDSQSVVQLAKNPMFHYRTKHIKRRYHYTRSLVKDGTMCLRKIVGSKNPADMLTKVVSSDKLRLCRTSIGLHH